MALPKLNSLPSYELKIPSTGQVVHYRPFLVKEQKTLLIALETQSRKDLLRSIVSTINACVDEEIKSSLTTYDVDYMFTMIRAKSVGEQTEIFVSCSGCEEKNKVVVELDKIKIANLDQADMLDLGNGISIKMRCPTYEEFLDSTNLTASESQSQLIFELVLICMDSVYTEEEHISIKDESREDIIGFIESMTTSQYELLAKFVQNVPYVYEEIEFNCTGCGTENKHILKGMDDFF